jgi:hypothetical protein
MATKEEEEAAIDITVLGSVNVTNGIYCCVVLQTRLMKWGLYKELLKVNRLGRSPNT